MTAEQLPVKPTGRPALPQPCIVCGLAVEQGSAWAYVEPPVQDNEGYLCASCTQETRALYAGIRDRNASRAARASEAAPEP